MFSYHLSDSPQIKNKENSFVYVNPIIYKFFQPLLSHTSLDQENSISHKIMNEVLNNGNDYITDQLESVNQKIAQYQNTIKNKITSLLSDSVTKSVDQSSLQKQLSDLRYEEKNYEQMQIDIDKQQSQVFDYYEQEFNKLKSNYETISQEHQEGINEKEKINELYNTLLENKAILREDLNARLLQRAELVGQKEELEEFVEQVKRNQAGVFEIASQLYMTNSQIKEMNSNIDGLEKAIRNLNEQKEEKKLQLSSYHQVSLFEVQLHQSNQKIKLLKNKIVPIQKSLNLPHPDTLFNEYITSYGMDGYETKLQGFIQQFRNNLFRQGNQGSNWGSMKEFVNQLEQFIISSIQQKQIQCQFNVLIQQKQLRMQNINQNNLGKRFSYRMKYVQWIFKLKLRDNKLKIQNNHFPILLFNRRGIIVNFKISIQEQFHERVDQLSNEAFQQYQEQNQEQLTIIEQQYGQEQCSEVLQQTYDELAELMLQQEQQVFNNTYKLIEKYYLQDQAIQVNIQSVDQQILPQLKTIVSQLSKLKKDLEKNILQEKPHQEKMHKIEQEIQQLELEFKTKIEALQNQENEITTKLSSVQSNIEAIQEQLLTRLKPNKALLEQEILKLNNILTSLQEQKVQLESIQYRSPSKQDSTRKSSNGVLAISKSLNQFKMRNSNTVVKGITPTKEAQNLYLIQKYNKQNQQPKGNLSKHNFSLKNIK